MRGAFSCLKRKRERKTVKIAPKAESVSHLLLFSDNKQSEIYPYSTITTGLKGEMSMENVSFRYKPNMPMGLNTVISESGGGISGGQRQRLIIARAIIGKPDVLFFDEATSALDNITQKIVADSLNELKCTRVVIAHRLSTVKNCDRIIMLEGGHIVKEGTYDELMAMNGRFTHLVKRQQI